MRRFYFRIGTFALGSPSGGCWEDDQIVSGATRQKAFSKALALIAKQGFAFETKIEICNKRGEIP